MLNSIEKNFAEKRELERETKLSEIYTGEKRNVVKWGSTMYFTSIQNTVNWFYSHF